MKFIEELLRDLEPIAPLDTGIRAEYSKDYTIKAVLFDIYGTLLVSSSGDIDKTEASENNLAQALKASNIELINDNENVLSTILFDFEHTIKICHEEARKNDIPYPEIDILSIWEIVLIHSRRKKLINFNGDANIMRLTCMYEFLSNKVFPMPGMKDVINYFHKMKMPLGIVSNAQFYTPVLMNYFLNRKVGLNEHIEFFDPELTVFSYKLGIGKPDTKLFDELVPVLHKKYGLKPSQVLFVGNDMLKDIYSSKLAGFKTALFAGDRRSLRLHSSDSRLKNFKADYIITELNQVTQITG